MVKTKDANGNPKKRIRSRGLSRGQGKEAHSVLKWNPVMAYPAEKQLSIRAPVPIPPPLAAQHQPSGPLPPPPQPLMHPPPPPAQQCTYMYPPPQPVQQMPPPPPMQQPFLPTQPPAPMHQFRAAATQHPVPMYHAPRGHPQPLPQREKTKQRIPPTGGEPVEKEHGCADPDFTMIRIVPHVACERNSKRSQYELSPAEQEYIDSNDQCKKRILDAIEDIRKSKSSTTPRRLRVACSNLPNKAEIFTKLSASESSKYETWVDSALDLPIGVYSPPPIDREKESLKDFLKKTRKIMDEAVFGQSNAKDEVVRLVCQWVCSGTTNSFAIGLEGAPGIGKTTFAKRALASAIGRPFVFIALGGASDAAFLTGHSYTYEGAIAGRLAESLRECKVSDPVIFIDELDKISKGSKGDEIANVLIHLTDREQNSHFRDKYFHGIDIDLSRAIFVFSFNSAKDVNPILLDRINVINMKTPSVEEKITICKKHLIPRAFRAASCDGKHFVKFSDDCIQHIIEKYTNEAGVRDLDRHIIHIVNTMNVFMNGGAACLPDLKLDVDDTATHFTCTNDMLEQMIGQERDQLLSCSSMMYN